MAYLICTKCPSWSVGKREDNKLSHVRPFRWSTW